MRALGGLVIAAALAVLTPATVRAQAAPDYAAIIAASDRSEADRKTDERREPVKVLAFTGAKPGMKVLDMGAGGGYSTEMMARAVTPGGTVYAQNGAASENFTKRAEGPAMKGVESLIRPFDDPTPPEVKDLDLITFFYAYHDTTFMPVDRAKMNKRLFEALKPGGVLVVADHSAKPGDGANVGKTLHRIEEATLKQEVEAAGFKLVASGDFLKHPEDPRDKPVFRPAVPVDEFILKFEKPR